MWAVLTTSLLPLAAAAAVPAMPADVQVARGSSTNNGTHKAQVIVLGGGISGISAARSLVSDYNVTDIILIEARDELGGRAHTDTMTNKKGKSVVVERGCNWIQGPGKEVITALADKWGLETSVSNYTNTSWYEGLGVGADGRHGKWLDTAEQEEFMSGYDTFLDNAPSYAGGLTQQNITNI
ncbi:uncharacterized protein EHS24_004436 [Apiotrichum porosum]|uniref:Amine oxidase domain-containing protein n=1 Tax=Apiotrichum porosum TaxID=105984 RepID=A0A427Y555_9TREE|nr:uncharacterized protein EHS24_004436 [Apiotrichum porosum]RSH86205.1 hypothetical protein EHS24_004436 [Apiotrichum porosum]